MGAGFVVHGWAKWSRRPAGFGKLLQQIGIPFPGFTAWAVTFLELAGGGGSLSIDQYRQRAERTGSNLPG